MSIKNYFFKGLVFLFRKKQQNSEKKFLIVSTTGLGDTLWGTPAIRALRESFPKAYIGVLTSKVGAELLKYNPRIDEIFVLKSPTNCELPPPLFFFKKEAPNHSPNLSHLATSCPSSLLLDCHRNNRNRRN